MNSLLQAAQPLLAPAFSLWGSPVTWPELVAFVLSIAMVVCNIRVNVAGWPLAIAASLLYFLLFWDSRLYGEASLQIFFVLVACGAGGSGCAAAATTDAPCACAPCRARAGWSCWSACSRPGRCWAAVLRHFTDTDVPWWDALPTAGSVVGQWLLGAQVRRELAGLGRRQPGQRRPVRLQGPVADGAALCAVHLDGAVGLARLAAPGRSGRRAMSPGLVVAIVGAESTGKSTLALALRDALAADGTRVACVSEALREFCDAHARTPRRHEQAGIAAEQSARIEAAAQSHAIVVADTTALMIAVYSDIVFGDRSLYDSALRAQAALWPDAADRARPALGGRRPAARRRARARAGRCAAARGACSGTQRATASSAARARRAPRRRLPLCAARRR